MDQNKKTQGQQHQSTQGQHGSRSNDNRNTESRPTRDPAEGSRDKAESNMGSQERGKGSHGEKNRSGISNRGMSPGEEQMELPSRGSSSDDDSMDRSER